MNIVGTVTSSMKKGVFALRIDLKHEKTSENCIRSNKSYED